MRTHGPLAHVLRRYMREEGIGYEELARRLGLPNRQTAWHVVNRNQRIHADVLRRMCELGIDLNEIASHGGDDDQIS